MCAAGQGEAPAAHGGAHGLLQGLACGEAARAARGVAPRGARDATAPWEAAIAPDTAVVGAGQRLGVEGLGAFFARVPRFAVAFSGGVDSAYLLAAAAHAGCKVKAYLVSTAFQPTFELADARRLVGKLNGAGFPVSLEVIKADVLSRDDICVNPPDRCYVCKGFIFGCVRAAAARDGYDVLVDGTNATDDPARRPGFRALDEAGVVSPLRRAGLTKAAVRAASRELSLPTAEKPRFACYAVHVPAGERITAAVLDRVAEELGTS